MEKKSRQMMQLFQSTPSAWRETDILQAITHRLVYFNPLPPHGGRHAGKYVALDIVLFQSTPSAWRETINNENSKYSSSFQSTPSAWRETVSEKAAGISHRFQSTPSAWRETIQTYTALPTDEFQSTPSAWRETDSASRIFSPSSHFNPLPPHGGRQIIITPSRVRRYISIHSLRMEGDKNGVVTTKRPNAISIHSLRMEGD